MNRFGILLVAISLGLSNEARADCSELLKDGLFDKTSILSDRQQFSNFQSLFCRNSANLTQSSQSSGVNLAAPVGDVMATFGMHSDKSNYAQASDAFCKADASEFSEKADVKIAITRANEALAKAFVECIATEVGFHGYIETTSDPRQFAVMLSYRAIGEPYETKIVQSVINPTGVQCKPALKKGEKIGANARPLNCTRNSDGAVLVTVATGHGSTVLKLPAYEAVAARIEPPCTKIDPTSKKCLVCEGKFNDVVLSSGGSPNFSCSGMVDNSTYSVQVKGLVRVLPSETLRNAVIKLSALGADGKPGEVWQFEDATHDASDFFAATSSVSTNSKIIPGALKINECLVNGHASTCRIDHATWQICAGSACP